MSRPVPKSSKRSSPAPDQLRTAIPDRKDPCTTCITTVNFPPKKVSGLFDRHSLDIVEDIEARASRVSRQHGAVHCLWRGVSSLVNVSYSEKAVTSGS